MKRLLLKYPVLNQILAHGRENAREEVCGIFTGTKLNDNNWLADKYHEITNVDEKFKKQHYIFHPQEFGDIICTTTLVDNSNEVDFVGIFHTHPHNQPEPSSIDIDQAGYNCFYLIYSPLYDNMTCSFCSELKKPWEKANFEVSQ